MQISHATIDCKVDLFGLQEAEENPMPTWPRLEGHGPSANSAMDQHVEK